MIKGGFLALFREEYVELSAYDIARSESSKLLEGMIEPCDVE